MKKTLLLVFLGHLGLTTDGQQALAATPSPSFQAVTAQIARARKSSAAPFQTLATIKARVPALDRRKRGRLAAVAPLLRPLGPRGLLPMLEALSTTRPEALTGTARQAWRIGLLEAVGALRDPRAAPILQRVLERESDGAIIRAAAAALGELGSAEALATLSALGRARGPQQLAVLAGMGRCRRLAAARLLTELLAQRPREEMAAVLVTALGELGSAWAWETPRLAQLGEGDAVRETAARALLDAFLAHEGEVRRASETAFLVVDAPRALELLGSARARARPDQRTALDRLTDRYRHSPLRPRGR